MMDWCLREFGGRLGHDADSVESAPPSKAAQLTRRAAVMALAGGGALLAAGGARVKVGSQTNAWPVNPQKFETLLTALDEIRDLGFTGFETGFRNVQPQFSRSAELKREWEQRKLTLFGVHIFLNEYDANTRVAPLALASTIAEGSASIGAERLILSGAPAQADGRLDREALKRKAEGLQAVAQRCKAHQLKLAYHNHGPEFAQGGEEIEALLSATDPASLQLVLDAGHAFKAGADVPAFLKRHHQRVAGIHLRDFKDGNQVPLGQGGFPLAAVARVLADVKWQGWVLTEEERLDGSKPGRAAVGPARQRIREEFKV